MKFIADAMLGKLAKRLRLLGFDVLYDPSWDHNEIIQRSLEQDRVVLTRDRGLASRPLAANHIFVASEHIDEQLDQIASLLPVVAPFTRCSVCNEPLQPAARDEIVDLVPEHVLHAFTSFLRCGNCGRVYWQGSHVAAMERK